MGVSGRDWQGVHLSLSKADNYPHSSVRNVQTARSPLSVRSQSPSEAQEGLRASTLPRFQPGRKGRPCHPHALSIAVIALSVLSLSFSPQPVFYPWQRRLRRATSSCCLFPPKHSALHSVSSLIRHHDSTLTLPKIPLGSDVPGLDVPFSLVPPVRSHSSHWFPPPLRSHNAGPPRRHFFHFRIPHSALEAQRRCRRNSLGSLGQTNQSES